MKHINLYDNYLTKKYQRKKNYDEYLYNNGFGDRYYICSNCGSHRLRPIPKGGMTPPDWICDDCGEKNYAPKCYTIHHNGSWEKFLLALDKLGLREDFLMNWGLEDFNDLSDENKKYFLNDSLALLIASNGYYYIRKNFNDFSKNTKHCQILRGHEKYIINGGDIYVEDWEVDANKYNL